MAAEFDAFAARMTAPLSGLAQLLTGNREAAATLVYTALIRAYPERVPDERRAVTTLVRTWLAGVPIGEPEEDLPHDLVLLRRVLDTLPDKQLVAVALHHWSGFSVPEIAAVTRRPERAVAADLAAGVAELQLPGEPDEPTVATRLAALVAAAGPVQVDAAEVVEAGRVQRRQRRRTAVVAGVVLLAVAAGATLLTGGEPESTLTTSPVWSSVSELRPLPVVDDRARRLTAQLAAVMDDVLPGVTDLEPGGGRRPPLEFATAPDWGPMNVYTAEATFGTTQLHIAVYSNDESYSPCSVPEVRQSCTSREFPDGTMAEVVVSPDFPGASLTSQRPDGTVFHVLTDTYGSPPALTAEDLFRFALVFTY